MIPLIDTHQHLWDLSLFNLPWLTDTAPFAGSHTLARYMQEAEGCGIAAALYMEVDVEPSQRAAEAEYVIGLSQDPAAITIGATIGGNPLHPDFHAYIERFGANPAVKGVRQVLHGGLQTTDFVTPAFIAGLKCLEPYDLHFDLCLRPNEIWAAAELADACPNIRFVLDHCGNGEPCSKDRSQWEADILKASARPNLICKISGIVAGASENWTAADLQSIIEHCAESFGTQRIVFGTDWPVCKQRSSLKAWVAVFRSITASWSEDEKHALYHRNAERFYGLPSV